MSIDPIITAAVSCRTRADVEALEETLRHRLDAPKDRFLGDSEANWSAVSSPADAAAVLFERNTNMWDALVEMEAQRAGRTDWPTPAAAAADLFGVVDGVGNLADEDRDRIARMATITLHDSDDSATKPTVSFRDFGIGLGTEEMPETILSLQRSNKLRKPYLHGAYSAKADRRPACSAMPP